jgi:hypothetical protein
MVMRKNNYTEPKTMSDISKPVKSVDVKSLIENQQLETTPQGHEKTWLLDRRIVIFRGTSSSSREAVDSYFDLVSNTFDTWPAGEPLLAGFDFRNVQFSTPYQMMVGQRMLMLRNDLPAFMALLLANSIAGQVGKLALSRFKRPNATVRAYFDLDEAILWLAKQALEAMQS